MKCSVCGNLIDANSKECAVCGTPVDQAEPRVKERFLTFKNQLLIISSVALSLLIIYFSLKVDTYQSLSKLPSQFYQGLPVLGVFGLVFGIPLLLALIFLLVIQILQLFEGKITGLNKVLPKIVKAGFIIHIVTLVAGFILFLWQAIAIGTVGSFFVDLLFLIGLQFLNISTYILTRPECPFKKEKPVQH